MSTPGLQTLVSEYHFPLEETRFLGQMADSRSEAGKVHVLGTVCAEKEENTQRLMGTCPGKILETA